MKSCLDEGDLQAYLDGELAAAAAHLASCPACTARLERVRSIAVSVDALLDELTELPAAPRLTVGARSVPRTRIAAVAAAAALLFVTVQGRPPQQLQQDVNYFLPVGDGDPIQLGTIVRTTLPASLFNPTGEAPDSAVVQAEVILDDDGHARAIRLLQ